MVRKGHERKKYKFYCSISKQEVSDTLRKMKSGKAVGLNCIPIEIWKCLGVEGIN